MPKQMPTVGDPIIYFPTDVEKTEMDKHGNTSEALPGIVVASWGPDMVNAKIFMDGDAPDLWKTSIHKGTDEMQWCWQWEHNK